MIFSGQKAVGRFENLAPPPPLPSQKSNGSALRLNIHPTCTNLASLILKQVLMQSVIFKRFLGSFTRSRPKCEKGVGINCPGGHLELIIVFFFQLNIFI